jgi:hypothetical protein
MSQKSAERIPKRMLVIYKEDMCTSILNIGKVKRILSGEAKLTEGSTVEVEFYGLDYEALVVKLHGTAICVQAQTANIFARFFTFQNGAFTVAN